MAFVFSIPYPNPCHSERSRARMRSGEVEESLFPHKLHCTPRDSSTHLLRTSAKQIFAQNDNSEITDIISPPSSSAAKSARRDTQCAAIRRAA